jgi:hypothetical protein
MDLDDRLEDDQDNTSNIRGEWDSVPSDLVDIAPVPEEYLAEPGDRVAQSMVLENIIDNTLHGASDVDPFEYKRHRNIKLSHLERRYKNEDPHSIDILSTRSTIVIDKGFKLDFGKGEIWMDTSATMIDYQLVVANSIGFDILLPNVANDHRFGFNMDLKQPRKRFKGKHGMVGFDTKGRMLYLGRANNEDVYLTMAPNEFFQRGFKLSAAGHSTGSSVMSQRHYRQMVMMLAHFLSMISDLAYMITGDGYIEDLEKSDLEWTDFTNIM